MASRNINVLLSLVDRFTEPLKKPIEMTKDTMQKTIADPVLDTLGNTVRNTGDKIFDKGGER